MTPSWPPPEAHHRHARGPIGRWLVPAALLALTPKCVLCVLAYAGLGATVAGLNGRELCGASPLDWPHVLVTTGAWLGGAGFVLLVGRRLFWNTSRAAER